MPRRRRVGDADVVLIIDDEPDMREFLRAALESVGIECHAAEPQGAVSALDELRPQVVLLDISMPSLHGYDVLRVIRSSPGLAAAFVIMVTGHRSVADVEEGLHRGADDYLTKPFHVDELVARVHRGLRVSAHIRS